MVREFEKGTHNVLVATSIGEEGLDIGEVDLIVCFGRADVGDADPALRAHIARSTRGAWWCS